MKHKKPTETILFELHSLISLKDTYEVSEYEQRLKLLLEEVDQQLIANEEGNKASNNLKYYLKLLLR